MVEDGTTGARLKSSSLGLVRSKDQGRARGWSSPVGFSCSMRRLTEGLPQT